MPASSKTVCGSPELSQQDMKVGTLSRRAELIDPNYSKDKDEFWHDLKKCDGEPTCIANLYSRRIEYLQKTIENGRALTPEEEQQAQLGDKKAEQRFSDQEDARKKYAAQSGANDISSQPEQHATQASMPDDRREPVASQQAPATQSISPDEQHDQDTKSGTANPPSAPNNSFKPTPLRGAA